MFNKCGINRNLEKNDGKYNELLERLVPDERSKCSGF